MKYISLILVCILVMVLSACGITKKDLGLSRQGPDESQVQTNQPLVLPPEFNVRPKVDTKDDKEKMTYFEDDED